MSTKVSALKQAVSAFKKAIGPHRYGVNGKPFVCQLCGYDRFKFGTGAKILGLYWLACAECSHIEFFAQRPPLLPDKGT
jgi:hypothetical protein